MRSLKILILNFATIYFWPTILWWINPVMWNASTALREIVSQIAGY